jgi:hypothetical protein
MRYLGSLLLALSVCIPAMAQGHSAHQAAEPATLMSGIGDLEHPVTTTSPEAQKFFDQGLRLIYAFNRDEAARSFRRAADLDPRMGPTASAMPQ